MQTRLFYQIKHHAIVLIAIFSLWVPLAYADTANTQSELTDWLQQMAKAVRTEHYHGVLIYFHNNQLDTLEIVHGFRQGQEQERIISLTGERQEMVRHGNRVETITPAAKTIRVSKNKPHQHLLARFGHINAQDFVKHYKIKQLAPQRQAGRPTHTIRIIPQDNLRYGYQIDIDKKTSLPLKLLLIDDGRILEQLMFAKVKFLNKIEPSRLQAHYKQDGFKIIETQSSNIKLKTKDLNVTKKGLPAGFEPIFEITQKNQTEGPVQQILFSDGVAAVSAFIVKKTDTKRLEGDTSMGAVHAYGVTTKGTHITVVGEVPKKTVRLIAQSLAKQHK